MGLSVAALPSTVSTSFRLSECSVDPTALERRDLGHVEDVVDVGAVPGDDERARVVDREVPERV